MTGYVCTYTPYYDLCSAEVRKLNKIPCLQCSECEFEGAGKALKEHQLMHILPDELKFTSEEDVGRCFREGVLNVFPLIGSGRTFRLARS